MQEKVKTNAEHERLRERLSLSFLPEAPPYLNPELDRKTALKIATKLLGRKHVSEALQEKHEQVARGKIIVPLLRKMQRMQLFSLRRLSENYIDKLPKKRQKDYYIKHLIYRVQYAFGSWSDAVEKHWQDFLLKTTKGKVMGILGLGKRKIRKTKLKEPSIARASAAEVSSEDKPKRIKKRAVEVTEAAVVAKKRGRPKKTEAAPAPVTPAKKRGRPKKDEAVTVPAKKKPKASATPQVKREKTPVNEAGIREGTINALIYDCLKSKKGMTKDEIHAKLVEKFKERDPQKMKNTLAVQLYVLPNKVDLEVVQDDKGRLRFK